MNIRAMVIDDEELARKRLLKMLQKYEGELEVVGEARNGEEALTRIEAIHPDIIFLDVQMPGMDGFEVVRRLHAKPFIIFATAYDEYALKAFEENSVDYLLKPIEQKRLDKAVEKLRRLLDGSRHQFNENVERLLLQLGTVALKRLQVKSGEKILLLDVEDIAYVEAKDKYTYIHTKEQKFISDFTLSELEEKLDKADFIRVHRSWIVNAKHILELVKWFGGRYKVRLKDKNRTELLVSRTYVDRVQKL